LYNIDAFVPFKNIGTIQTCTLRTETEISFWITAITKIPITPCKVVIVIAETITLICQGTTTTYYLTDALITICYICAIPTLTICTKVVTVINTTAVTTVPIATSVVVIVITETISYIISSSTSANNNINAGITLCYICAIPTLTLVAI
jgi:hypothetical protein